MKRSPGYQRDQLETLAALIDEGTFEAAARRLHVTASAVSQRVKAMETSAGRVLVKRTVPVEPTEAGAVLLRYARQVELLESDARRALGDTGGGLDSPSGRDGRRAIPTIALAVNADSLATWFLPALQGLGDRLGVTFDLHREDQARTASLLRSGTVMAAVTATREAVQGCTIEGLGVMRYRAVCSPQFRRGLEHAHPEPAVSPPEDAPAGPTTGRSALDPARGAAVDPARGAAVDPSGSTALDPALARALADAPVVHFDRNDDLQEAFLREHGIPVGRGPRHYIPTSDDFARAVALGFGWGVLPEQQCAGPLRAGELVDLAPTAPVDVRLHWQRWNLGSETLDAVSDAVRKAARASLHP